MAVIASLVFLTALFLMGYALHATLAPALPRIRELMQEQPPAGKPLMIHFGIDRRTAYRMECEQRLVALKGSVRQQAPAYSPIWLRHAA